MSAVRTFSGVRAVVNCQNIVWCQRSCQLSEHYLVSEQLLAVRTFSGVRAVVNCQNILWCQSSCQLSEHSLVSEQLSAVRTFSVYCRIGWVSEQVKCNRSECSLVFRDGPADHGPRPEAGGGEKERTSDGWQQKVTSATATSGLG